MRYSLINVPAVLFACVICFSAAVAAAQRATEAMLPPGARAAEEADRDDVTETLGEVTEAAMTVGGFNDLVERLVDADRNRIGDVSGGDLATLNGRVQQLQELWQRRYDRAFRVNEEVVFGDGFGGLRIASGLIMNPVQFAKNWPLDPTPRQQGGIRRDVEIEAYGVADDRQGYDYESDDLGGIDEGVYDDEFGYADGFGYDGFYGYGYYPGIYDAYGYDGAYADTTLIEDAAQKNIQRGREVAVVRFPARGELPALNVSMIDEAYGWKIDIPETVGGPQLRQRLLNHLTYLGENPRAWPRDRHEASRLFAHHVIMAVYGLDVPAYQRGQQSTGGTSASSSSGSSDVRTIEIVARDLDFHPNRITARPGEKVRIKLSNEGTRPHNIEFELPSGEVELDKPVQPGEAKTLTFTAPQKPGTYTVYCPVGQHQERGMTGTLVVRPEAQQ